jgi:hypothetical protein
MTDRPNACQACGSETSQWHFIEIGGGFPKQRVCINPTHCRERAQAAGTWCVYNRPEVTT